MNSNNQKYYLEKEWFEDVILLSKKDILDEIRNIEGEIRSIKATSFLKLLLRLLHQ